MPEPENPEATSEPRVKSGKIDAVRQFVQMMKDNDLTALDFVDGSTQIRLRRGGQAVAPVAYAPAPPPPTMPAPAAPAAPGAPAATPAAPAAPAGLVIESPMVGTFYSSSSPEAPSFVTVGATVRADTTVCIIEAMKVFTDIPAGSVIPAGASGTITEVLVKNGQSVEFGQPLFRVKVG